MLEGLARVAIGLFIGYIIGLNVKCAVSDLYFSSIGSQRRKIPMACATFGALIALSVVWPYWRRRSQSATVGTQGMAEPALSLGEKSLKGQIATLTRGAIVACGCAGVGLVLGYLIGLGVRESVVEVVEIYLWRYQSRISVAFAITGAGLLV